MLQLNKSKLTSSILSIDIFHNYIPPNIKLRISQEKKNPQKPIPTVAAADKTIHHFLRQFDNLESFPSTATRLIINKLQICNNLFITELLAIIFIFTSNAETHDNSCRSTHADSSSVLCPPFVGASSRDCPALFLVRIAPIVSFPPK